MAPSSARRLWPLAGLIALLGLVVVWSWPRGETRPAAIPPAHAETATTTNKLAVTPGSRSNSSGATGQSAALQAALQIGDLRLRSREFGQQLELWLQRDADAAFAYVRALPAGPEQSQGLLMTLRWFARIDPDRTLALARDLAVTPELRSIYSSLFAQLAGQDLNGAIQRLAQAPAGSSRANALSAVMDVWAKKDVAAALAWAEKLQDAAERSVALETTLATLASVDPLRTVEVAQKALTGAPLERTIGLALRTLIETDLPAATALVSLLPSGETRTLATAGVARALVARTPAEAVAWVDALPAGEQQTVARRAMLEAWTARNPGAAAAYVGTLAPGPEQTVAADQLARVWGATAPDAAIAWAQAMPISSARESALFSVASAWAQTDAPAACRWAATLGDAGVQAPALRSALSYWVLQDPRGAQEFVGGLADDLQPPAALAIAPDLAQRDPTAALAWAQSLPNSRSRESATIAAFARWHDNAPAAAAAWLAQSTVPQELKARLQAGRPR